MKRKTVVKKKEKIPVYVDWYKRDAEGLTVAERMELNLLL